MGLDWFRARRTEKRIGGFGPVGWVAAAVFLAILIPSVSGFSWQFLLLESIWRVWDYPGVYWYILKVMFPLSISVPYPGITVLSVLPVMIGMKLAPVRLGLWRYALLFAAGTVAPLIAYHLYKPMSSMLYGGPEWLLSIVPAAIAVVATYVCTRSWVVSLSWLAVVPLTLTEHLYYSSSMSGFVITFPQLMNTSFELTPVWVVSFMIPGVASLWWARMLRRELFKPETCRACGYSTSGIAGELCPECGAALQIPLS
ncbi:MAG: hypothetical protein ACI89L_000881 [Phycisphaerales bacterium]|jgi:hypothetical protein